MPGKGKPKPVLPLQNKKRQEKARKPGTKKSKRRKTNYKSFFDIPFHTGAGRSILSELNRIQNALKKKATSSSTKNSHIQNGFHHLK